MASFPVNKTLLTGVGIGPTVIPASMSGTTFICGTPTANAGVTLPNATTPGLKYKFITSATFGFTMTFSAVTGPMRGYYMNAGGDVTMAAAASIGFGAVAGTGSMISVESCLLYTSPSPRDGLLSR